MTKITLKQVAKNRWQLFSSKGFPVSGIVRMDEFKAIEWANIYISSWPDWSLELEETKDVVKKS
jgi:hypothetical protein